MRNMPNCDTLYSLASVEHMHVTRGNTSLLCCLDHSFHYKLHITLIQSKTISQPGTGKILAFCVT
jgi:hypothetical protein